MTTPKKTTPKADIRSPQQITLEAVLEATTKWKETNTEAVLKDKAVRLLDQNSKEIVMKLLGFDSSYGKSWELDHCNGRSGNSIAGDFIAKVQKATIEEWLSKIPMPTLSDKELQDLSNTLKGDFVHRTRAALVRRIDNHANAVADQLFESLRVSGLLEDYAKTSELLGINIAETPHSKED